MDEAKQEARAGQAASAAPALTSAEQRSGEALGQSRSGLAAERNADAPAPSSAAGGDTTTGGVPAQPTVSLNPEIMATQPNVIKRACPGWLVLAQIGSPIPFGVEGATLSEALERFHEAREAWARLAAMP